MRLYVERVYKMHRQNALHIGKLMVAGLVLLVLMALSACATKPDPVDVGLAETDQFLLQSLPSQTLSYAESVRPVLQRRCVVCHGCYDAPCQLKLSSPEGIRRGANKEKLYNGSRFSTASPTRLFIDAKTTEQWRGKGFHAVLNEGEQAPVANLEQSVMYKMLRLKQINPQARVGILPASFDLSLDRPQTCPTLEEFDEYAEKFPRQGMPFGLPNLDDDEYRVLVQWLAQGAPMPDVAQPSAQVAAQIGRWETFLNGTSNKQRLVSRYLYEHLFIGHIYFKGSGKREFYRLVRSKTPPGQPVDEIGTLRPYDDPGPVFYYRLLRYPGDIVAKTHLVYELSNERMARYRELFLKPDYEVAVLPSWDPKVAANPFKVFRDIPPISRYRFLLDDARYFIEGFTKGPVCRGMIALNVIEDRFWVAFLAPDPDFLTNNADFLDEMSDYLETPTVQGDDVPLLGVWRDYQAREREYNNRRFDHFASQEKQDINDAIRAVWDGDGSNPNAALTVFRHFDSASVSTGFIGDYPESAWIIDYPSLERIHYLLVAGFNVFGNVAHQLHTRLYMDFLRMEGEDLFLSFLPTKDRKQIRDAWYQGMRKEQQEDIGDVATWLNTDVVSGYRTDNPQREFYQHLSERLAKVLQTDGPMKNCRQPPCENPNAEAEKLRVDRAMQRIAEIRGEVLAAFPDVAFVRVRRGKGPDNDLAYTVIRDKAYKNVASIFDDEEDTEARDYSNDALTVVDWLEGSYPNFFFSVDIADVDKFTEQYAALRNREDFEKLISLYGIRRTNSRFWDTADWFQDQYLREEPIQAGLLDLNRYYSWR
jgi:hypothetical protein